MFSEVAEIARVARAISIFTNSNENSNVEKPGTSTNQQLNNYLFNFTSDINPQFYEDPLRVILPSSLSKIKKKNSHSVNL